MIKNNFNFNKNFYEKNGWVIEKELFKKNEILLIKKKIKKYLKENIKNYKGREINFSGKKKRASHINSFHKLEDSSIIKKLSKDKKIINIAKKYIDTKKIDLRACELFAKPAKNGLPSPIHQDNYYWWVKKARALTIWVAVDEVTSKNGGIFYFNGSHKEGLIEHTSSYQKGSSQKIKYLKKLKKYKKTTPKLQPGDCLIHHVLVAHGSKKNNSEKPRMGFTFQFKDSSCSYDLKMKQRYENSLNSQIKLRDLY